MQLGRPFHSHGGPVFPLISISGTAVKFKRKTLLTVLVLLVLSTLASVHTLPVSFASLDPATQPMIFYFHNSTLPVVTGGVSTHLLMDTTRSFENPTKLNKPIGQPKVEVDFYLYPALAAPVTLSGTWQGVIWVNASALHPATWSLVFWERSPQGSIVWTSTQVTGTTQVSGGPSGSPGFVDVPPSGYTLSLANITHTFQPGNSIEVGITINTGSTVSATLWFDSQRFSSHAVLPSNDYALPSSIRTLDVNGTERNVFQVFWSEPQRKVQVVVDVADPWGGYDVANVLLSLYDPSGKVILANQSLSKFSGTSFSYVNMYTGSWDYPSDAFPGTYRIIVYVVDNNGAYQFQSFGTYSPFIESREATFSVGILYRVQVRVLDSHQQPLVNVLIHAEVNGQPVAQQRTNSTGWIDLQLASGNYDIVAFWQGVSVMSNPVTVDSPKTLVLQAAVYYPRFVIVSNLGDPLNLAMVFLSVPNGTNIRLPYLTNANGALDFMQMAGGRYSLLVFWEGIAVADSSFNISSDGPFSVRTQVYRLTVNVTDNSSKPLQGVYVEAESTGGRVFDFGVTGSSGFAAFNLAKGDYTIKTYYNSTYWLSSISNFSKISVSVTGDTTLPVSLSNIPPPIWTTIGFVEIIAVVLAVLALVFVFRRVRKR